MRDGILEVKCERYNGRWRLTIRYLDGTVSKSLFDFVINALEEASHRCKKAGEP